jgi:hypothetical protein
MLSCSQAAAALFEALLAVEQTASREPHRLQSYDSFVLQSAGGDTALACGGAIDSEGGAAEKTCEVRAPLRTGPTDMCATKALLLCGPFLSKEPFAHVSSRKRQLL